MKPIDSKVLYKCTIERTKDLLSGSVFRMTNSDDGSFLLNAKKITTAFTSQYLISMVDKMFEKNYSQIGKIRADFTGQQ